MTNLLVRVVFRILFFRVIVIQVSVYNLFIKSTTVSDPT